MRSDGKQFGKQQPKPAGLGTERQRTSFSAPHVGTTCGNRRTHDAAPRTQNTKQETSDPRGPKIPLVPSFRSSVLPAGILGRSESPAGISRQPNFPLVPSSRSSVLPNGKLGQSSSLGELGAPCSQRRTSAGSEISSEISQLPNSSFRFPVSGSRHQC